jgi:hypothetical protein
MTSIVESKISIDRLKSFLCCDEYISIGEGPLHHNGVSLTEVTAMYDRKECTSDSEDDSEEDSEDDEDGYQPETDESDLENHEVEALVDTVNTSSGVISLNKISLRCEPGDFIAIGT